MSDTVWGLDIGGTKCAVVLGDREGKVLARRQIATAEHPQWEELLENLIAPAMRDWETPLAIGVSCGGPLSGKRGLIMSPPNLPGWDNVPVCAWLKERTGCRAYLQNDANACALAEWMYGAGRGTENMIFLTFGTGMGAGLILDGRLYAGIDDMAGEVGHMRMAADGPVGYGKRGSFEGFCSGGGLKQLANLRLQKDLTAKDLALLAAQGDTDALAVFDECAEYLGRGLAIMIDILNPERIVIGSVYARAGQYLEKRMREVIAREALPISGARCEIVPAQLGDAIGDIAALTIAWNGLKREGETK